LPGSWGFAFQGGRLSWLVRFSNTRLPFFLFPSLLALALLHFAVALAASNRTGRFRRPFGLESLVAPFAGSGEVCHQPGALRLRFRSLPRYFAPRMTV
jgi:hypothetical protein